MEGVLKMRTRAAKTANCKPKSAFTTDHELEKCINTPIILWCDGCKCFTPIKTTNIHFLCPLVKPAHPPNCRSDSGEGINLYFNGQLTDHIVLRQKNKKEEER